MLPIGQLLSLVFWRSVKLHCLGGHPLMEFRHIGRRALFFLVDEFVELRHLFMGDGQQFLLRLKAFGLQQETHGRRRINIDVPITKIVLILGVDARVVV